MWKRKQKKKRLFQQIMDDHHESITRVAWGYIDAAHRHEDLEASSTFQLNLDQELALDLPWGKEIDVNLETSGVKERDHNRCSEVPVSRVVELLSATEDSSNKAR